MEGNNMTATWALNPWQENSHMGSPRMETNHKAFKINSHKALTKRKTTQGI